MRLCTVWRRRFACARVLELSGQAVVFSKRRIRWLVIVLLLAGVAAFAAWAQLAGKRSPRQWTVRVLAAYPHDPAAFTQGLAIAGGQLYEGTGEYGASSIRRVNMVSGRVEKLVALPPRFFGEGIAVVDHRLYQLTWRSGVGFVYDLDSFEQLASFSYDGEGWGLTQDGMQLIMSDGSATLRFLDPQSLEVTRSVTVRADGESVTQLNELEYIDGEIWANIWHEDRIARIAPNDGRVLGWIDVGSLYQAVTRGREDVANGIAYDADSGRLLMTGKDWPQLFEVKVVSR